MMSVVEWRSFQVNPAMKTDPSKNINQCNFHSISDRRWFDTSLCSVQASRLPTRAYCGGSRFAGSRTAGQALTTSFQSPIGKMKNEKLIRERVSFLCLLADYIE